MKIHVLSACKVLRHGAGRTFIFNEIYLNRRHNPEIWCEFMSWEDNPHLSAKEIKLLDSALDKSALDARKYGKFSVLPARNHGYVRNPAFGQVFQNFRLGDVALDLRG